MTQRGAVPLFLVLALAGCEQTDQELPFSTANQTTEKTVAAGGGTISTSAGASVAFPAGSVGQSTTVTLTPVAAPAATQQSGTPVSTSFRLEPAGTVLSKPAEVAVKLDPTRTGDRAWLATVVNVTPQGVQEIGNTRVDLSTGVIDASIGTLGTLSAVVPEDRAVVVVGSVPVRAELPTSEAGTAAVTLTPTRAVQMACGGPGSRCEGLAVGVSQNLLDMVKRAAALYPKIQVDLRIDGTRASGRIVVNTTLRAHLKSGRTAENVAFSIQVDPTARTVVRETTSEIHFSNMRFRISGGQGSESGTEERIASLVIPKPGASGLVTVDRSFNFRSDPEGAMEKASVKVTFPVKLQR